MAAYAASKSTDRDAWIAVQKKTFTRWANNHLKKRSIEIGDLFEDTKNGVALLNLLEIIGGESIKSVLGVKYNKKPKMRIHMLENGNRVIDYCKKRQLTFVNVGANDFVDGNGRIILGFVWKVILRFVVSEDGQAGLLLWCQRSTKPYDNIEIKNFHRSWKDGLGFVGIIHRYRPDLIADPATLNPEDAAANCELAFSVAEEKLGISRLLDVEDIVGTPKPDEKSIATYMNEFYLLFATQMQADHYVDAIVKACQVTRRHDEMIARYNTGAEFLTEWTAATNAKYAGFEYGNTTDGIREQLMDFYEYRNKDKPSRAGQIVELQGVLNSLRSSCKSNNRPLFEPAENLGSAKIESGWVELEETENAHEARLRDLYTKYQEVDFAAQKFATRADKFERWAAEKMAIFEESNFGEGVTGAEICVNSHNIYEKQLEKFDALVQELGSLAEVCAGVPDHSESAGVVERNGTVQERLGALKAAGAAYKEALDGHLDRVSRLDALEKDLAKNGALALYDADDLEARITEPIVAGQVAAVQEKLAELNGPVAADLEDLTGRLDGLRQNLADLSALSKEHREKSKNSLHKRRSSSMAMKTNMPIVNLVEGEEGGADGRLKAQRDHRLAELEEALGVEQGKEDVRKAFAEAAQAVRGDCDAKTKQLAELSGEPEDQIEALDALSSQHAESKLMKPAEEASSACDKAGVVINPYTPETIFTLRSQWDEIGKAYKQARNIAEKAIMDKAGTQLTPEQIAEIREVFDYFDVDKDGLLSLKEFQDGCQGMGMVMDEEQSENHFNVLNGGKDLTFDLFSNFMYDQMKTGTSLGDVLAAFRSLASGDSITEVAVNQHFGSREDYAQYLLDNMPANEDGSRNFADFSQQLFTR